MKKYFFLFALGFSLIVGKQAIAYDVETYYIKPFNNGIVAITSQGWYHIKDGGEKWTLLSKGIAHQNTNGIYTEGEKIVVYSNYTKYATDFSGKKEKINRLFYSPNSGVSWDSVNLDHASIENFLAIIDGEMYATANPYAKNGGLMKSIDNGKTWVNINKGLKDLAILNVFKSGTTLYASSKFDGVFSLNKDGGTWSVLKGTKDKACVGSTQNKEGVFVGESGTTIYKISTTGEVTKVNRISEYVSKLVSLHSNDKDFYAYTDGGLYYSSDHAITFKKSDCKSQYETLKYFDAFAADQDCLYGLVKQNLWVSIDKGANWYLATAGYYAILRDEQRKKYKEQEAVSIDEFKKGKFEWWNKTYRQDVSYPASFSRNGDKIFLVSDHGTLYFSQYKGTDWNSVYYRNDTAVHAVLLAGNTVYMGTGNGLFMSVDDGKRWNRCSQGITFPEKTFHLHDYHTSYRNKSVNAVISFQNRLYVATFNGVFYSKDNGKSWEPTGNKGLTDLSVYALVFKGNTLYAGTPSGLFISSDNGKNWTLLCAEINPVSNDPSKPSIYRKPLNIRSLAFWGDSLIAGLHLDGCTVSGDNGKTWSIATEQKKLSENYHAPNEGDNSAIAAYFIRETARDRSWYAEIRRQSLAEHQERVRENTMQIDPKVLYDYEEKNGICHSCHGRGVVMRQKVARQKGDYDRNGNVTYDNNGRYDVVENGLYKLTVVTEPFPCTDCKMTGRSK